MAPRFTKFLFFLKTWIAMATLCFDFLQTWGIQLIAQQQIYSLFWDHHALFLRNISFRARSEFDIVSNCLASNIKWEGGVLHTRQRGVGHTSIIFILKVLTAAGKVGWESMLCWMRIQEGFYILKLLYYAILTWNSLHCDNCSHPTGSTSLFKINNHSDTVKL